MAEHTEILVRKRWLLLDTLLLFVFFGYTTAEAKTIYNPADRENLITFYQSLEDNTGKSLLNWNTSSENFSTWQGITTLAIDSINDTYVYVSGIIVPDRKLTGIIPNLEFPYLKQLDLSDNDLQGNLTNIKAPNLEILNVYKNDFSFQIQDLSFDNLTYLNLEENNITGLIEEFSPPKKLDHLNISKNAIEGGVPNGHFDSIKHINIRINKISWYHQKILPHHQYVDLSRNEIYSPCPEMTNIDSLRYLDISLNRFFNLRPIHGPMLETLDLRSNNFSDSIPSIIMDKPYSDDWPKGYSLNLSGNAFTKGYGNIYVEFPNYIELSNNQLTALNEKIHAPNARLFMRNNKLSSINLDSIDINAKTVYLSDNLIDTILGSSEEDNPLPIIQLRKNYLTFRDLEMLPPENFESFLGSYDEQKYEVPLIYIPEKRLITIGYLTNEFESVTWRYEDGTESIGDTLNLSQVGLIKVEISHSKFPELILKGSIFIPAIISGFEIENLKKFATDFHFQKWMDNTGWSKLTENEPQVLIDSLFGLQSANIDDGQEFKSYVSNMDLSWNQLSSGTDTLALPYLINADLSHNHISYIDHIYLPNIQQLDISDNNLKEVPTLDISMSNAFTLDMSYNKLPFIQIDNFNGPDDIILKISPQFPDIELTTNSRSLICPDSSANNSYTWLLSGDSIAITNEPYYQPNTSGNYSCMVSNEKYEWDYITKETPFIYSGVEQLKLPLNHDPIIHYVCSIDGRIIEGVKDVRLSDLNQLLSRGVYWTFPKESQLDTFSYEIKKIVIK